MDGLNVWWQYARLYSGEITWKACDCWRLKCAP